MKKGILLGIGFLSFGLGFIGNLLPVLPTVPFLLLSSVCFIKSSKKANDWFVGTKVYNHYLKTFIERKGMTLSAKLWIIFPVGLIMLVVFISSSNWVLRSIIIALFIIKIIVFIKVPTLRIKDES